MADELPSELSKIAKLNGDFRKNYGRVLGAVLYLLSISAARRAPPWAGLILAFGTAILTWVAKYGWSWSNPS